jgi:hypothetical protein
MRTLSVLLVTCLTASFGMVGQAPSSAQEISGCTARLSARDPRSQINVRTGAGTNYPAPSYGLVGDQVQILRGNVDGFAIATDRNGARWVKVRFPKSQVVGWVRRDLVSNFTG